jgi:hypothetical protein
MEGADQWGAENKQEKQELHYLPKKNICKIFIPYPTICASNPVPCIDPSLAELEIAKDVLQSTRHLGLLVIDLGFCCIDPIFNQEENIRAGNDRGCSIFFRAFCSCHGFYMSWQYWKLAFA